MKPSRGDFLLLAGEERHQIEAVEMDFECLVADLVTLLHFLGQIGFAVRCREGRNEVLQRAYVVDDAAGLDNAGPTHDARNTPAAFPVRIFLAPERRRAAIRPRHHFRAVVRREDDDGVVGNAKIVQLFEELADIAVEFDHPVGIEAEARSCLRRMASDAGRRASASG